MLVQRQLQLRIEAQGKYLKKIIEEQQRLSGVLAESPDLTGVRAPISNTGGNGCQDSDNKTDPSTPAPTSESPLQDKANPVASAAAGGLLKNHTHDESFSSRHEPLTPDSSGRIGSPSESLRQERAVKKQRSSVGGSGSGGSGLGNTRLVLANNIFESSSGSDF